MAKPNYCLNLSCINISHMPIINIFADITLLTDILLLISLFYWLIGNFFPVKFLDPVYRFCKKHAIFMAFIVALAASSGSLFFSEVLKFVPCRLCWFQRIFMYPQALLLGLAVYYKDDKIRKYIIPMCLIGGSISAYNYYLQLYPPNILACSLNSVDSCSQRIFMLYGYITFAVMAFTASALILTLMLLHKYYPAPNKLPRAPQPNH